MTIRISNKSLALLTALLCVSSFVLLTSCTVKQQNNTTRTVTVQGSGEVTLKSDRATIMLAVQTRSYDINWTVTDNANRMTRVQQALIDAGISKDDISTTGYTINQQFTYQNGNSYPGQFVVSNNIQVMVRDVAKAGQIIDTAVRSGATSLTSLTFSASNRDEAVKQARILAVKQAEETAALLASTSGAVLGKIITITDNDSGLYPRSAATILSESKANTPIAEGSTTISASVSATFELE